MEPEKNNDASEQGQCRFPDLLELQDEIARRIRDNRKFLERFMDEDFEEELGQESAPEGEDPEEL